MAYCPKARSKRVRCVSVRSATHMACGFVKLMKAIGCGSGLNLGHATAKHF